MNLLKNLPELKFKGEPALKQKPRDLERLYKLVIERQAVNVLELGCGYSTIVIEKALKKNDKLLNRKTKLHCIETNKDWIDEVSQYTKKAEYLHTKSRIREELKDRGVVYHLYDTFPNIVPDFVYIDGPDPAEVEGWKSNYLPVSFDLLMYEKYLKVGTTVLIDGRVINTVMLRKFISRKWAMYYSFDDDVTIMILIDKWSQKKSVCHSIIEWLAENG